MKTLYSLRNSPATRPRRPYQRIDIAAERFTSACRLHRALHKHPPDFFVGELTDDPGRCLARN